jgi:hypothetical protein
MASDTIDYAGVCSFLEALVNQLVRDAQIDITRINYPRGILEADYRRRKALYDIEVMKDDPEGSGLLNVLSSITRVGVLDILDGICRRAGVPWDIQPDVLADGPRLRLYDALCGECMDGEDEDIEQGQEAA